MKNFVLLIAAMLLSIQAYAFEFDGINLNDDVIKVTRAISSKKYVQVRSKMDGYGYLGESDRAGAASGKGSRNGH